MKDESLRLLVAKYLMMNEVIIIEKYVRQFMDYMPDHRSYIPRFKVLDNLIATCVCHIHVTIRENYYVYLPELNI